ncbi:MAG: exo-alpha-sialidase, partial [Candidatus Stahlbacteria bacterium]|nr:exo-alpha-sialidase [Candidatus Stahlbacteria bacterium]
MKGMKVSFLVVALWGVAQGQWEADKRLTVYPNYFDYGSCNNAWTIAVQDTFVHIVWEHWGGPGELYYIRSVNSGSSFEPDKQLTTQNSHFPSIAVRDSVVHVVWYDERDGNEEIYYKRSIDNGDNWEADERLTNDLNYSWYPSIAVRDSIVHVVWTDDRDGNEEIYYKRSIDNGDNWEADVGLTNDLNYSRFPSIAVRDSIVHIVWMDNRDGNHEIYYKRSLDNGNTWEPDVRLTNDPNNFWFPSIAVRDSIVHIV